MLIRVIRQRVDNQQLQFICLFSLSKMPNQRKLVVTVRSARCSTKSILTFGTLFFVVAAIFFGVQATRLSSKLVKNGRSSNEMISPAYGWFYWFVGYPIVIGIWIDVTGTVGMCATSPRRSKNKCLIATFGIFCLVLLGSECYVISDFMPKLKFFIKALKNGACDDSVVFWDNCYFNLTLYGSFVLLAALVLLHSVWCVICCIGSFVHESDVQPRAQDEEQQVPQPTPAPDMMMQESPPPYNPALQASTDNLQGNAPVVYNSGPPVNPTMQGNTQMQATVPPIYPALQEDIESTQGNAIPMIQVTSGEKNAI